MKEEGIFYPKITHFKKNYFQPPKSSVGYNKNKARGSNLARSCYTNLVSTHIAHPADLACFQQCSNWELTIVTSYNKVIYQKDNFVGKVSSSQCRQEKNFQMNQSVMDFLPIDIKSNQQFALDRNQSKLNLSIEFDLEKQNSAFTQVNNDYSMLIFEILLNGNLHGCLMLKDHINFTVKGYDIIKSIQTKLTEVARNMNQNSIPPVNYMNMNSYFTQVFANIQCTFGVDFSISNLNLSKLHVINYFTIGNSDVKITKLYIDYSLPLCVFSWRNNKGTSAIAIANPLLVHMATSTAFMPNRTTTSQRLFNKYDVSRKVNTQTISLQPRGNFCNWHSFMTFTTPIIIETAELKVIDIFKSLERASIFGITCLFRTDLAFYTQIKYYPTLSSMFIDFNTSGQSNLNTSMNKTGLVFTNTNDTSTLDGSFFSSLSAQEDKEREKEYLNTTTTTNNNTNKSKNAIAFKEYSREIYQTPCLVSRIKEIMKEYPDLEDASLGEISDESWFSLVWTPARTVQVQMGSMFVEYPNDTSFTVYYKLRNATLSNVGHYLPVFGVVAKSLKGSCIPKGTPWDEVFWFSNQAKNSNKIYLTEDFCTNKQNFYRFVENANKIEL